MKKNQLLTATITICLTCLFIASSAIAGVDPGTRDSVWFVPETFEWDGDSTFVTEVHAVTDVALKHATVVLSWTTSEIDIDSVSIAGSRWESFVDGDSGVFIATPGHIGGVPSDVHYNLSFLPFGPLLTTGTGLVCKIHWSKTVPTVSAGSVDVDSSTTSSASQVQNSTLFGTSGLPDDNFTPAFSGASFTVTTCVCPSQGDMNNDGFIDSTDLSLIIDVVFFGGPDIQDPICPKARADMNCDGFSDSVDLSLVIDHVFFGGAGPCDPCE